MSRASLLAALLLLGLAIDARAWQETAAGQTAAPAVETVTEIRVHGNATMADEDIIRLAGITVGDKLDANTIAAIQRRLHDSGRFDEVEVRKRYRTLGMDQVAIVLLVHERPGVR
ncbi:MAG TPA: FtsQ-type POTRA domain-containing protein, partial [Vicinamibacterales bacterium]